MWHLSCFRFYLICGWKVKCNHVNDVTFYTMLLPRSKCRAAKGSWTCRLWSKFTRCRWEAQSGRLGCVPTSRAHPSVDGESLKTPCGSFGLSVTSRCHLYITEVLQRHPLNYSGWCFIVLLCFKEMCLVFVNHLLKGYIIKYYLLKRL